jgi:hypothetical protein
MTAVKSDAKHCLISVAVLTLKSNQFMAEYFVKINVYSWQTSINLMANSKEVRCLHQPSFLQQQLTNRYPEHML